MNIENLQPGIKYSYYEGEWDSLPNFESLKVIDNGVIKNFDVLHQNKQDDHYGFSFTGYIKFESDGVYRFFTESDDGSCLYIDDNLIVNNDGPHGMVEKNGVIALSKGIHKIKVTYFEATGSNDLKVRYEGPGITFKAIPDSVLFYKDK